MAEKPPISLAALQIDFRASSLLDEIFQWPFADSYVRRLLQNDIPQRMVFGRARMLAYCDSIKKELIGFGTIDYCLDYSEYTNNKIHPFIPLLAVKPGKERQGYGNRGVPPSKHS